MRVFGLWYGDSSYSFGELFTDCESWATLADAKHDLRHRYRNGYWSSASRAVAVNVDREEGTATLGPASEALCPAVTEESYIDLYPTQRMGRGKWAVGDEPYARLVLGPRGGVRVESY